MLGFLGIALGIAVARLEGVESTRGEIAAWLLIGFGLYDSDVVSAWLKLFSDKPIYHSVSESSSRHHFVSILPGFINYG